MYSKGGREGRREGMEVNEEAVFRGLRDAGREKILREF